jgi:hypothetical protein
MMYTKYAYNLCFNPTFWLELKDIWFCSPSSWLKNGVVLTCKLIVHQELSRGTLAESMALTRKLMANLQRVETAENEIAIKLNLRAELALRQEQVDIMKSSKGTGTRRYWKTSSPFSVLQQPPSREASQVCTNMEWFVFSRSDSCIPFLGGHPMKIAKDLETLYIQEAWQLVNQMRMEHRQAKLSNHRQKARIVQVLSLHCMYTVLLLHEVLAEARISLNGQSHWATSCQAVLVSSASQMSRSQCSHILHRLMLWPFFLCLLSPSVALL